MAKKVARVAASTRVGAACPFLVRRLDGRCESVGVEGHTVLLPGDVLEVPVEDFGGANGLLVDIPNRECVLIRGGLPCPDPVPVAEVPLEGEVVIASLGASNRDGWTTTFLNRRGYYRLVAKR